MLAFKQLFTFLKHAVPLKKLLRHVLPSSGQNGSNFSLINLNKQGKELSVQVLWPAIETCGQIY
jgi:hypothetical protein